MKLHSAVFYSKDITILKEFYVDFLEATLEYQTGERFISFVFENGYRLGIKKADKEREVPGSQTIFVEVPHIDNWYKKAQDYKQNIYKELVEQSWGKSFSVLDPDGNKIEFIEERSK